MKAKNKYISRKKQLNIIWVNLLKSLKKPGLEILLNKILSQYEKNLIANRLAAISLIKQGKSYKEIGEELWLSPSTIRSLKSIMANSNTEEYQTYRQVKRVAREKIEGEKKDVFIPESSPFFDAIDTFFNRIPKRTGFKGTRRF